MSVRRYTLERKHFEFEIEGEAGQVKRYVAKEADASAGVKWKNATVGRASAEGDKWRVGDIGDSDLILISDCVCEQVETQGQKKDRNVSIADVRRWPNHIIDELAREIKEMSGLLPKEDAETLRKRIAKDQEKLAKLEAGEDEVKN